MRERVLEPGERWQGERVWFGNVVKCGRLAAGLRGPHEHVIGLTHLTLYGGHYFTFELWRRGYYLTWFRAD